MVLLSFQLVLRVLPTLLVVLKEGKKQKGFSWPPVPASYEKLIMPQAHPQLNRVYLALPYYNLPPLIWKTNIGIPSSAYAMILKQEQRYKWERKRRLRWKKSTQYKLKQGYKQDDPEVDLLREPTGKFNYYALAITSEPEKTTASEQVSMSQMLSEGMSRLSLENRQASERKKGRHPPMVERWLLDKYDQDCHKMSAQNFINPSQLITPPGTQIQLQLNKEELPEVAMIALIRGKSTDSEKDTSVVKEPADTIHIFPLSRASQVERAVLYPITWAKLGRPLSKAYLISWIWKDSPTSPLTLMRLFQQSAILAFTADSVKAVESSVDLVDLVSSAYVDSFASSDHRLRSVAHPASTESLKEHKKLTLQSLFSSLSSPSSLSELSHSLSSPSASANKATTDLSASPSSLAASPSPLNSGKMSFPFPMVNLFHTLAQALSDNKTFYPARKRRSKQMMLLEVRLIRPTLKLPMPLPRKQPDALGTSSANLMKSHETSNSFRAKVLIYCTPARSGSGLAIRRDHHFSQYSFAQLREASRYATYTFLWARSDLERKGLKASQGRQQLSPFPGEGRLVNSALRRSDSGQLRFDFFMS
ncbi:hypothetical protein Acr_00g0000330 [Actinidia rufa]|uniref:Uncharacterized protein n=1 Tax=Actinidia rufa TaxID=165716 RepID=A0A7J0D847_9ERIC|nr:hypothetical protein Acr_00g0000330 [Actinidia rufa]